MLEHAQSGDLKAAEDLLSLLQEELRELVALKMADQRPPSTPCNPQPFYTKPTCARSEEHTSELQSRGHLVCRLPLEKKNIRLPVAHFPRFRPVGPLLLACDAPH